VQKWLNLSRCHLGFWDADSGGGKEACIRWGAHWHHLANTIEPSMCGGDVVLRQITLITCLCYLMWFAIQCDNYDCRVGE